MNQQLEVTFKNGEVYYYPADERGWAPAVRGGHRYLLVGYAMIPTDEVEKWRLVEPAPRPDPVEVEEVVRWAEQQARRCPFTWTEDGQPQRCEKVVGHRAVHEPRRPCPARAWLRGVGYPCETPASYPHTEHGNATAGLMWSERTS